MAPEGPYALVGVLVAVAEWAVDCVDEAAADPELVELGVVAVGADAVVVGGGADCVGVGAWLLAT
jgi:hypothetical protein